MKASCENCKKRKTEFSDRFECDVDLCTGQIDYRESTTKTTIYLECSRQDLSEGCSIFEPRENVKKERINELRDGILDAIADAKYLQKEGIVSKDDMFEIIDGLLAARQDVEKLMEKRE
jgi:hypothetical protein